MEFDRRLGLQEEEARGAQPISITWASHRADTVLIPNADFTKAIHPVIAVRSHRINVLSGQLNAMGNLEGIHATKQHY